MHIRSRMTIVVVNTNIVPGQPDGGGGGTSIGIGEPVNNPA